MCQPSLCTKINKNMRLNRFFFSFVQIMGGIFPIASDTKIMPQLSVLVLTKTGHDFRLRGHTRFIMRTLDACEVLTISDCSNVAISATTVTISWYSDCIDRNNFVETELQEFSRMCAHVGHFGVVPPARLD